MCFIYFNSFESVFLTPREEDVSNKGSLSPTLRIRFGDFICASQSLAVAMNVYYYEAGVSAPCWMYQDTYCLGHYLLVLVVGGLHQRPPLHTLTLVKYIPWHLHSSLIKYILRDVIVFTLSSCNLYHMRAKGSYRRLGWDGTPPGGKCLRYKCKLKFVP